jgi:hypothetical protein
VPARVLADLVDGHDVRVVQVGDVLGLAAEAAHLLLGGQFPRLDHLQRHDPVGGHLPGLVDHAHATVAHLLQQLIPRESARRGTPRVGQRAGRGGRGAGGRRRRRCGPVVGGVRIGRGWVVGGMPGGVARGVAQRRLAVLGRAGIRRRIGPVCLGGAIRRCLALVVAGVAAARRTLTVLLGRHARTRGAAVAVSATAHGPRSPGTKPRQTDGTDPFHVERAHLNLSPTATPGKSPAGRSSPPQPVLIVVLAQPPRAVLRKKVTPRR